MHWSGTVVRHSMVVAIPGISLLFFDLSSRFFCIIYADLSAYNVDVLIDIYNFAETKRSWLNT